MPATNLTRDEARARSALLAVESYEVTLDLTTGDKVFRSETLVRFGSREPAAPTWLDLVAPGVHEVVVNGEPRDPAEVHDGVRLHLDGLAASNEVRVVADGAYMHTGEGLHRFVDPVDGAVYLYSQFEEMDARRVYACFDQPDLKASFTFTVTAPAGWQVLSNYPVQGEPEPLAGDKARWRFHPTPRLSTYVTVVVAGPYAGERAELTSSDGRTIPLGVYARASMVEHLDADDVLTLTRQGFEHFERAFGHPYPFSKYDQVFCPEFNAGAMENAGCVTLAEDYLFRSRVTRAAFEGRANTVLHELAHMWFGDLVTMRWWDDLWLNESFAEWASYACMAEATEFTDAWTAFAAERKAWAYREDQLPSTHPIAADMVDLETVALNFDGITYAKGASALRQLVAYVGEEDFLRGLRAYFAQHAWDNATLGDLVDALEAASGRDLGPWIEQWLRTAGVSTLSAQIELADDGAYAAVAVRQTPPEDHPHRRPHRLRVGLFDLTGAGLERRTAVELDVSGELTAVPELSGQRSADLLLVNDGDLTYAKVRLDPRSLATVRDSLGELPDPVARAVCWLTAIDMLRDGELAARDFVTLTLASIRAETSDAIVKRVLPSGRSAVQLYADPDTREQLADRWRAGLRELVNDAEPGSDRQLSFVRAWAAVASGDDDVAFLRELLAGEATLEELAVDTDLRWSLLARLAALGAAGEDDISAELERDPTATGGLRAAYARAARPTMEAKEDVWARCVDGDEVPNAVLWEMVSGFAQPEQRELLRGYVDRYFDGLTRVWSTRTPEMAQNLVTVLFPRLLAEPATVERTDAWSAGTPEATAGLRRLVSEGRADVVRALRAQAADAAAAARQDTTG